MTSAETLTAETKALLLHGMQNLVSSLGEVMGAGEGGEDQGVH